MQFRFEPMDETAAREIAGWRYDPPYDLYNGDADAVPEMLDPDNRYIAVRDEAGTVVGFCCFGASAQVPSGDYPPGPLDIGLGLRPDLTGHGGGGAFLNAVLDFAVSRCAPPALRLTVAEFNRRAWRVYERAGFREHSSFMSAGRRSPRRFLVLTRPADARRHEGA